MDGLLLLLLFIGGGGMLLGLIFDEDILSVIGAFCYAGAILLTLAAFLLTNTDSDSCHCCNDSCVSSVVTYDCEECGHSVTEHKHCSKVNETEIAKAEPETTNNVHIKLFCDCAECKADTSDKQIITVSENCKEPDNTKDTENRFCSFCGLKFDETDKYCSGCGKEKINK